MNHRNIVHVSSRHPTTGGADGGPHLSGRELERVERAMRRWIERGYGVAPVPVDGLEHPEDEPCPVCSGQSADVVVEIQPFKPHEYGRYVCVASPIGSGDCLHSPHITIHRRGLWVRSLNPDPLNPGKHLYSSAHRDCFDARWANYNNERSDASE